MTHSETPSLPHSDTPALPPCHAPRPKVNEYATLLVLLIVVAIAALCIRPFLTAQTAALTPSTQPIKTLGPTSSEPLLH